MQASSTQAKPHPLLPSTLSLPLKLIPSSIHNRTLVATLNRIFQNDLQEGELDFLLGKTVQITVEDAGIEYRLSLSEGKLIPANRNQAPDLLLKGTIYDYLLLASRREDTDTLFFSRRLHMQGDTELGLYVKNFLDGLDMDSHKLSAYMERALQKSLPVYERLFGQGSR